MLICHDISQIKENLRLQELNKATNLMASYMSHEMITPLQCVSQLADKVSQDVDLENKYYLRTINTTIKLLLSTIKENLDSSMLSVSQFVLKPSNLALIESVIQPVLEILSVNARFANVTLEFSDFLDCDPVVKIDKIRTQ